MQLTRHLNFYIGSVEATEARIVEIEQKVADAEKEHCEAETWAFKAEGKFWKQKEHVDTLSKNSVYSMIKLGKASSCVALMCQKMTDACYREAQTISDAEAEIAELEKSFQVETKDLKTEANSRIQWFWKELNLARSENEWFCKEIHLASNQIQGKGSSEQDERVQQAEQARDEAIAKVQFLQQAFEEK